jgi:hypothetical protein
MSRFQRLASAAALAACYALPSRAAPLPRVSFESCGSAVTVVRLSASAAGCAASAGEVARAHAVAPVQVAKPTSMKPLPLRAIDRVHSDETMGFSWIPIPIRKEEALQRQPSKPEVGPQ